MNVGHFENPDQIEEYLTSLQRQIDALRSSNDRMRRRIKTLENERDLLRSRLPWWVRGRNATPRVAASESVNSIDIPGVGRIDDVRLPRGPIARPHVHVATILDEFSDAAFGYEVSTTRLSALEWSSQVENQVFDALLVESAYRGYEASWSNRIARFGQPSAELIALVTWFRDRGIPTIFWNKEDPINHDWFLASATLFDWVLTVDSNMVDSYRKQLTHPRVGVMQFGAQPVIHHPGDESRRVAKVAFAGSYYAEKHPNRRAQMEMLLEPAVEFGLHIFDRMDRQDDPRFAWPEKYEDYVLASLTYPQTLESYRRYRSFINVNTITDSPTMCARRVYELLASGAQVVSGPSMALDSVPVRIARNADEARSHLEASLSAGLNEAGIDWIASGNTMAHRVDQMLSLVID